jgi:hypothetical protein
MVPRWGLKISNVGPHRSYEALGTIKMLGTLLSSYCCVNINLDKVVWWGGPVLTGNFDSNR